MRVVFSTRAWEDYLYWQKTDPRMVERINALIHDTRRSPIDGIGKPELLKHGLAGYSSRRINSEHRIVYTVKGGDLLIAQLRYHY